ncbi:MAG: universal stress protein [Pseudomonadota bacterium]
MYKNVLVAVAFHQDDQDMKAIDVADALRSDDGKVTLLHVVEDVQSYVAHQIPEGIIEKTRDAAKDAIREIAETTNVDVQTRVVYGHSGRTILDYLVSPSAILGLFSWLDRHTCRASCQLCRACNAIGSTTIPSTRASRCASTSQPRLHQTYSMIDHSHDAARSFDDVVASIDWLFGDTTIIFP